MLQVRGLGEAIREHQSWIAGLSNQQAVLAHGRLRRELRRKALPLVEELARLVSSGSVLYHSVEERDYEAENRRDRELDRASSRYDEMSARAKQAHHLALLGRKKALYHQVPQPLGHLRGRSLVLAQEPLAVRLTAHSTRFDALAETALRLPAAADLKGLARTGHNLLATLGDLLGEIDDARAFFTPQHLEWIGLWWVETNSDDTVKAIMGGLGIIDADGDVRAEIVMPAELRPIDRAPLEDMTRRFAGKVSA